MKLIGLHGLPRSGKDTVAQILAESYGFQRLSFADPLKKAAALLLRRPEEHCQGIGYDREQIMPEWGFSMRWFLQKLGTEGIRDAIRQDFWIRRMLVEIEARTVLAVARDKKLNLVISDVRFPNEAHFIRAYGGVMVNVVRPGATGSAHASDQPLECDLVVHNDGTLEDLYQRICTEDVLKLKGDYR